MSKFTHRSRLVLMAGFSVLWLLLLTAPGASASGAPPQCFDTGPITLEQGARFSFTAGQACIDPEGDPLTLVVTDPPDHGALAGPDPSGLYTYTAPSDYVGPDSFSGKANDGTSDSNVATASFNIVEAVDDPPVCFASFVNSVVGTDGRFAVEDGDASQGSIACADNEGADLTFSVFDGPDHGSLSPLQESPPFPGFQSATFTYTPIPAYRGPDEFTLRTSDGTHSVDTVVRVTVVEQVNDPPQCFAGLSGGVPGPDGRTPVEAGEPSPGSMFCTDDEGANLTFSVLDGPEHGTLSPLQEVPNAPGSESVTFTYTPDAAYRGTDEFTLRASDGANDVDRTIRVNVLEPVNDAPLCNAGLIAVPRPDGRFPVQADAPMPGSISCSDDERADLTFTVLDGPDHGTLSPLQEPPFPGFESATFTYTPIVDYRGEDEFTLRASDGTNNVDRTIQVIVVEPVDDPPQCFLPGPISVEQGERLVFHAHTACSDPEGEPLTLVITDQPDHGPPITGPDQAGFFTYTAPGPPFTGQDSFGVEISDGVNTIAGTVTIQVIPFQNDPPQCFGNFVVVRQPESVRVLPACFDGDGQELSFAVTQQPQHGSLTGDPANEGWTYTPNVGFTGTDSFSYRANDGEAVSQVVTVQITVLTADRIALAPTVDTPELGSTHTVTTTVRDGSGAPQAGKRVRWSIEGAGPAITGDALTDSSGRVDISWARSVVGTDELSAYVDDDGDAVQDPGEPVEVARAHWRAPSDVEPPDAGDPTSPAGAPLPGVTIGELIDPDKPGERYFAVSRPQTTAAGIGPCPGVPDSRAMNLPISVVIDPGAGTVVAGTVELFQVAAGAGADAAPLTPPGVMEPSDVDGDNYTFVIDCVRTGDLYVRYTLDENGNTQTFTVPIGGIVLIDPQGVVYDREVYDERIAAGDSAEKARAAAAIEGATVTLQRKVGDDFVTVLSGDPGILPHINPQTTGPDGRYQWDVSAGVYRVVVEKDGYESQTSQAVTIPPPVLDLHIALEPADTTPPETTITGGPTGTTADSRPIFTFMSNEAGSTFECSVDGSAFAPCTSPHTTEALANGSHTFDVRARDASGNVDESPARRSFVVATAQGGGGGGGGGGDTGGPPKGPCEGLTGPAQARCRLDLRIERKCGALKAKKKRLCEKRERALAKCKSLPAKTRKQKAKKKSCLRAAKKIGAKTR